MVGHPKDVLNDKLAPKLIKRVLLFTSGLLAFIGKPLYIILFVVASIALFAPNIIGWSLVNIYRLALKIFKKVLKKARKKSGIIYNSKKKKPNPLTFARLKIFSKKLYKRLKNIPWKLEVVLIAIPKVISKLVRFYVNFTEIRKKASLLLLKTKLVALTLKSVIPKPTLPKISKLKLLFWFSATLFLASFISGALFWQFILKDLPKPQDLTNRKISVSTKIYDRNGILLYTIFKDQNRTPVSLEDIPNHVKLATIAIEDAEFYSHPGFSIRGIIRAIVANLRRGELAGGSTITQQLVKNALLTPEKTVVRKLKEITLAIQVELAYSKDEILEMYLNEVSYGGTAYGIQEASKMYFNKEVKDLSLSEAALLAGLPKSPTRYSPLGSNPEIAFARQKEVLNLMQINGFITRKQKEKALDAKITFAENKIPIKAPHFVFFVREILEEKYQSAVVEQGGLEVTTTLDYQIQKLAEEVVKEEVDKLGKLNVTNGAAIVLNPKTGEILAMAGSKDFFNSEIDGNVNVATRPRQPGSSIKVVNYSYALSNGFTAATIIPDSPVTFLVDGQPPYTPKNYEAGFRGNLTLRSALAESRNIPAVRILHTFGIDKMLKQGQKMGITTWREPSNYGLSLTLGGGEVKLIDLAQVYATIANYGQIPKLVSILKVTNYKGNVLEEFNCENNENQIEQAQDVNQKQQKNSVSAATQSALKVSDDKTPNSCNTEQVLDPRVSFIITDILRDNSARSPAFGTNSLLNIAGHKEVAVKTGTSNDLRDNLAIGYNQNYVVAVWVGNNDNSQMARIASGVTGATPIFNKIMSALLAKEKNDDWPVPSGLIQLPICPLTGTLACEGCPVKQEWFLEENKPELACNSDWFKAQETSPETSTESATIQQNKVQFEVDLNNQLFEKLLEEQIKLRKKIPRGRN